MDYAFAEWDKDRDGLMEGEQHNTYDIEFYGPNSMMGAFYLGALEAASEMAAAMGDREASAEYRRVYDSGRAAYERVLWNGEYYVQKFDKVMETKYQYGEGCLSDQLLGQWLGMVTGLGRYLPEEHIRTALDSIFKYNFMSDFRNFSNAQRTYALGDEKGLLLCSWPKGGRPPLPFPYSDEVWTGIEYQVASHLIYEGRLEEGLTIVKAVRDRYDGRRRNPWDEVECGHHYARAMSSWGVLLALSGFSYSGPEMAMGFEPRISSDAFRTVWTAGSGWGTYSQKKERGSGLEMTLTVEAGEVKLREFSFAPPGDLMAKGPGSVTAALGGSAVEVSAGEGVSSGSGPGRMTVRFSEPVTVEPGRPLTLSFSR